MRIDAAPGDPRQQFVGAGQRRHVGAAAAFNPAIGRGLAVRHDQPAVDDLRALGNVNDEDAGVMDDGAVAGTNLQRFSEAILGERDRRIEHLHAELAFGGDRELDRHLEHVVRLAAGGPAFREFRQRRQIGVIALRRAGVHPRHDRVDLFLGETAVVAHRQTALGVGAPRRHFARAHLLANRLGPGAHVLVREERHRRHFTGPVAHRAFVEHDRRHIFGEGGGCAGHRSRCADGSPVGRVDNDGQGPESRDGDALHGLLRRTV